LSKSSAELDIEGVECDETIQTGEIQTGESGEDIRHLQRSNIRGGKLSQHRHVSSTGTILIETALYIVRRTHSFFPDSAAAVVESVQMQLESRQYGSQVEQD